MNRYTPIANIELFVFSQQSKCQESGSPSTQLWTEPCDESLMKSLFESERHRRSCRKQLKSIYDVLWDQSRACGLLSIFSAAFKAISHFQS